MTLTGTESENLENPLTFYIKFIIKNRMKTTAQGKFFFRIHIRQFRGTKNSLTENCCD